MRKFFLFVVAALFATNLWAEEDAFSNFSFDESTAQLSFHDSFHEGHSFPSRLYTVLFAADKVDLSFGNGIRMDYGINNGKGGDIIISLGNTFQKAVDSCFALGADTLRIRVVGCYYDEIGWSQSYRDNYVFGGGYEYDLKYQLPSIRTYVLAGQKYYFYSEDVPEVINLSAHMRALDKVTYAWQQSTDGGKTWQSAPNYATNGLDAEPDYGGYFTTKEARQGQYVDYRCRFNKLGKKETLYRLNLKDVKGDVYTTEVFAVNFAYPWQINGGIQFWAKMDEEILIPKPQDCSDYRYDAAQVVKVSENKENPDYLSITMPGCPLNIETITPTYVVKFLNADYSLLKADTVECGDAAEAPADPTYGNYTFIGWNKDLTNVHSNMSVLAKYDIGNDYDLFVSLDEHKNKVFPADYFEGSGTRAMVGDVLTFKAGIFAVTDASLYYETAQWNLSEQKWIWPSQQEGGKKVGDYKANTTGLLSQDITVCYDANTQFIHPFEHRLAVRFYLLIAGVRVYSEPFEFDVYYPIGIRTSTAEGVLAENNAGDVAVGTPVMIPARSNDTIRVYGMNGSGGDCFTYRRVIKSSMAVDNGVDEEDNAYFLAPGELDTIVISVAQTAVVFEVPGQGKSEYSKYGSSTYYAEEVDCGGSIAHMPEDPEEAGSIFLGWESWNSSDYPDDAYLNVPSGFSVIGFTAKWEEIPAVPQYQVRFYGKDGAPLLQDTLINEGENAVPPVAPEVSGFHFVGWDKPYTTITANTDITALYGEDAKTWTVTYYDADETTKLGEETVNDGEAAQGIAVVAPVGQHFAYWVYKSSYGIADLSHITTNEEVFAHYDVNIYEITYTIDGNIIFSENVNHGAMPTQYEAVEDQGKPSTEQYVYTFDHWNPAIVVATEDATYEAVFTESLRKYTVRFQNWDHTLLKEEPVEYGKAATAPADPVRKGYTFKGWDRAFNNIITDMTVTAVFEKNKEQGLEDIRVDGDTAQKVLVDGTLYIALPDGRIYNANGLRVK